MSNSKILIGDFAKIGDVIGTIVGEKVYAEIDGVLRGLIRPGSRVVRGVKVGDIDPRADKRKCDIVSDKARSIGGGVLEAIIGRFLTSNNF